MKLSTQPKWVKWHRLAQRILDANASSRVEGEFSKLWRQGLTSGLTYRTSITKMRFGAEQRNYRKIVSAETYLGSKLKRRDAPMYGCSVNDWRYLCDKFTRHYMKSIEQQIRAAYEFLTCQLVQKSEHGASWKVWSKRFTEEDVVESEDSDADIQRDSDDENEQGPEQFENDNDQMDCPDFPVVHGAVLEDEDGVEAKPFKWRHVRTVTATRVGNKYEFSCSCRYLERTCVICRHIFFVFWYVFNAWRISAVAWHKRTTRKYFYSTVVTDRPLNADLSTEHVHPTCTCDELNAWLDGHEASEDGVPIPGEIVSEVDEDHNQDSFQDHQGDDHEEPETGGGTSRKRRRQFVNAALCDQKLGAITNHLGPQQSNSSGYTTLLATLGSFMARTMSVEAVAEAIKVSLGPPSTNQHGWSLYHKCLEQHLTLVTSQAPGSTVGAPKSRRMLAHYEGGSASTQEPRTNTVATTAPRSTPHGIQPIPVIAGPERRPFGWSLNFPGRANIGARDYLLKYGGMETWIVEVYAKEGVSGSAYTAGDRWFMTIKNGLVQGPQDDEYITACRWNKANSRTELDPEWPGNERCELRQVKRYGPPNCPIFN